MYGTKSADDGRGRSTDSTDMQSAGRDGVDHISDLSEDLLLHVLRFLPDARDLARTSALSRRWRHLWTSAPVLCLCAPQFGSNSTKPEPDEDARFNAFVHNVLARRAYSDASVDTLELRSWRWPGDLLADVWLRRAMRLTVNSLYYSVRRPRMKLMSKHLADKLRPRLWLPRSTRAVTMSLGLNNAALLLPRMVDFHALADLTLAGMVFLDDNGDRLGSLLSSSCCPRLRKLKLTYLSGLEELQLNGRALEMLHLRDLWDLRRFHVNAPLLSSLRVDGYFMLHRSHEPTSSFTIRAPALQTENIF